MRLNGAESGSAISLRPLAGGRERYWREDHLVARRMFWTWHGGPDFGPEGHHSLHLHHSTSGKRQLV